MASGGGPPSPSRDGLNLMSLMIKCIAFGRRQRLHPLERVLPHSVGVLIPTERGRTPILTGSLVQLGGTVVPRSTKQ